MNKEHTEKLFAAFPRLFRGRVLPVSQNLMPFGFECNDGWFALLYHLCTDIVAYAATRGLDPIAVQVKEKYGALRVYIHEGDEHIEGLCYAAERRSQFVCEECGAPGALTKDRGWIVTRCPEHNLGA